MKTEMAQPAITSAARAWGRGSTRLSLPMAMIPPGMSTVHGKKAPAELLDEVGERPARGGGVGPRP